MHQGVDLQRDLLLPRQLVEMAQVGLVVQAVDKDLPGHPPQEHAGGLPDAGLDEVAVPDAEDPADLRYLLCRRPVRLRAGRRRGLPGGPEVGLDPVDELVRQVPVLPLVRPETTDLRQELAMRKSSRVPHFSARQAGSDSTARPGLTPG